MRLLEWTRVPCWVRDLDPLRERLARLDENWMRHDLSVLERAEHLAERSDILRQLGVRRQVGGQAAEPDTVSGSPLKSTIEVAADAGISGRTLQRYERIATRISKEVRDLIRTTKLADSTTGLVRVARATAEQQRQVAKELIQNANRQDAEEQEEQGPPPRQAAGTPTDQGTQAAPPSTTLAGEPVHEAEQPVGGGEEDQATATQVSSGDPAPARPEQEQETTRDESHGLSSCVQAEMRVERDAMVIESDKIRVGRMLPFTCPVRIVPRWKADLWRAVEDGEAVLIPPDLEVPGITEQRRP